MVLLDLSSLKYPNRLLCVNVFELRGAEELMGKSMHCDLLTVIWDAIRRASEVSNAHNKPIKRTCLS